MGTARAESLAPEPAHHHIVRRTIEACRLTKEAAGAAAEGIATGSSALLNSLRQRERDLDTLDMEIDSAVTSTITEVEPTEARELLSKVAKIHLNGMAGEESVVRRTGRFRMTTLVLIALAQIVDEHLLNRLVIGLKDMANRMPTDQVAHFFGQILRMVAGTFQRLGHENNL